jgi:hypothetical protein
MDLNLWLSSNNHKITFDEFLNNNDYKYDRKLYFHQVKEYNNDKINKEFITNMINWSYKFFNDEYSQLYMWINSTNNEEDPITLYSKQNNLHISDSESIPLFNTTSSSLDSDLSSNSSDIFINSED